MAAAENKVVAVRQNNPWGAFQQLFAGVAAGVATTLCTHPLDLIKTRMQSSSSRALQGLIAS
jgi:Mitochondrial carrier protein